MRKGMNYFHVYWGFQYFFDIVRQKFILCVVKINKKKYLLTNRSFINNESLSNLSRVSLRNSLQRTAMKKVYRCRKFKGTTLCGDNFLTFALFNLEA